MFIENNSDSSNILKNQFNSNFHWGVSTAAYQIEGAHNVDGKGASIWDTFTKQKNKIYSAQNANISTDFYHRYEEDLELMREMGIKNFRFSISWSRILPLGTNEKINTSGIDFYNKVINCCLQKGITPWVTLYHWDLPQELENKGGWRTRKIVDWFTDYVEICVKHFGDRVTNWMVLNEPLVFTGAGYFFGLHAPGKKGLSNFIPAVHHAALCQAEGLRIIKSYYPHSFVGSTFSCAPVHPYKNTLKDNLAAQRTDALLNRLFIEPSLGLGYPLKELKWLERIYKYYQKNDEKALIANFDFIGVQNYTREVVKHSYFVPLMRARLVEAKKRKVPYTSMGWEIYPDAKYEILKKYNAYSGIKKMIITENGASFDDKIINETIRDSEREKYIKNNLFSLKKAIEENCRVEGYFVWTFLDNFEWAEGYRPKFGLVHVDFETQKRTIKNSGKWYSEFIKN